MSRTFWVAAGIVGVIVVIVAILASGGSGGGTSADASGDVVVSDGPAAPAEIALADVSSAEVRRDNEAMIFEVKVSDALPSKIPDGSIEFRWIISEDGADTWIVLATVNVGVVAAVTSQETNYGSSTIDSTLPGTVSIDGDTLRVTLRVADIKGFPADFDWRLTTALDGDRADPGSATATDTAPDSGSGQVTD